MYKGEVQFANFICRFGNDYVLLDWAHEVVLPAYLRNETVRKVGRTRYILHNMDLVNFGDDKFPVLAICGQFIKDTILRREQIYSDENELVQDEQSIQSSPSAFFVLNLNSHRLIYYPETAYSPTLANFEATSNKILKENHAKYINDLYDEKKSWGEKIKKIDLFRKVPKPSVKVNPLSSKDSLESFIKRYELLKVAKIELTDVNDETDFNEMMKAVRRSKELSNSKSTQLVHKNTSEGLNKDVLVENYSDLGSLGNYRMSFSGIDHRGDKLVGNNHDFSLKVEVGDLQGNTPDRAQYLHDIYEELKDEDVINVPDESSSVLAKIKELFAKLTEE